MKISFAALVLLASLGGCGSGSSPNANSAAPLCKLTESPNACVRCWAQKCPNQLDRCFGDGFHSGELISGNTAGSSCRDFSICVQACGCLDGCFDSCKGNIHPVCSDCQQMIFSPCRAEKCAAECSPADGGA
jgi:hypothetical protein